MSKQIRNIKEAFSYTTQVNGQSWDPTSNRAAFNVMSGLGNMEDNIRNMRKDEERTSKAPKILPFPLDRIIDQLAKMYETSLATRQTITTTHRTAVLNKHEKALLRLNVKRVDNVIATIKKISKDIEKLEL